MKDGAFVAAISSAILVAALFLGWRLAGLPFLPFDVFDLLARGLPGSLASAGIDLTVSALRIAHITNIGSAAKTIEQAMALAAFFAAAIVLGSALFGALRRSDESGLLVGIVLGGMLGGLSLVGEQRLHRIAPAVLRNGSWIVGMLLAWGASVGWAYDALRQVAALASSATDHSASRRAFIIRLAVSAAVPSLLMAAWGLVTGRRAGLAGARWSDQHPLPNAGAEVIPVFGTRPEFTPLDDHYRIDIDTRGPVVDEASWRLTIGGLVDTPQTLTMNDLRREEPLHQFVTLSCISNPIGGDLIGTTRWTGVSLRNVLRRCGLRATATHVGIKSADGFSEVISLDVVENDPRVMLTYAWDGLPLMAEHGFPLRIYIPDLYGMKQPKWIDAIEILDRWEPGYWISRGWDPTGRMKSTSFVEAVERTTVAAERRGERSASVGGMAHAGARRVSRVEVRVNDDEWIDASLRDPLSDTTWVVWRADVPLDRNQNTLTVRCYDGDGTLQPAPLHNRRVRLA
jgi:DMSO/TMAO reductase YedYZ molybdopterin-dependent catalytic subunit